MAAIEFKLDFRIGCHRGEVGFSSVTATGYGAPGAMHETFQPAELSVG